VGDVRLVKMTAQNETNAHVMRRLEGLQGTSGKVMVAEFLQFGQMVVNHQNPEVPRQRVCKTILDLLELQVRYSAPLDGPAECRIDPLNHDSFALPSRRQVGLDELPIPSEWVE